jgi:excinuclease ABC subunit C
LEEIPGIGKKTIEQLLSHLKSVKRVKESTIEVLEESIGKSKAQLVWNYFHAE